YVEHRYVRCFVGLSFFFSSRRRHTRSKRDWSSDVCSSDLEDMLSKCSTKDAPWYVIPSNHKWFRNLAVSQIICATLKDIGMKMPEPWVDIAAVRQMYHRAATEQAKIGRASCRERGGVPGGR